MKLNLYFIAGLALASGFMASCSSSDESGETPNITPTKTRVVGQAMDDVTASMQSTLINTASPSYAGINLNTTRATGSGYDLAALGIPQIISEPSVPSDAVEYDYSKGNQRQPGNKVVTGNHEASINFEQDWPDWPNGQPQILNLYIKGHLTLNAGYGGHANIYILKGGSLTIKPGISNMLNNGGVTIYNWGTLDKQGDFVIGSSEAVYNAGTITSSEGKKFDVQGKFYTNGDVKGYSSYTFRNGCRINILGALDMTGKDVEMEGNIHVGGKLTANTLTMKGAGDLINDCGIFINGGLTTNSVNNIYAQYISCDDLFQCANAKIYLGDTGFMEIRGTYTNLNNGNDGAIVLTDATKADGTQAQAVIIADKIIFNSGGSSSTQADPEDGTLDDVYFIKTPADAKGNQGKVGVKCDNWQYYINVSEKIMSRVLKQKEVDFMVASVQPITDANSKQFSIPDDDCHGGKGFNPDIKPDPTPQVISGQHTHNISATCVQSDGTNVYLSFHRRGAKMSGCLERLVTRGDSTVLLQFVRDHNNSIDFNHLCYDKAGKCVYVVGNNKNGGFLGYIGLDDNGNFNCQSEKKDGLDSTEIVNRVYEPLKIVKLRQANENANGRLSNGGDGNAVIVNDSVLQVASTYGYEFFNKNLQGLGTLKTPGKAKHIAFTNMGNGNEVIASYFKEPVTGDSAQAIPLAIRTYAKNDLYFEKPIREFDAHDVTPNNGKNTICEYGDRIYSCQGARGLYVYDKNTGSEVGHYIETFPDTEKGKIAAATTAANGVAVDAKYVYVAYGNSGLIVLNRETLKEVTRFVKARSANYVALAGGRIYVAYGLSNIQVYQLPSSLR